MKRTRRGPRMDTSARAMLDEKPPASADYARPHGEPCAEGCCTDTGAEPGLRQDGLLIDPAPEQVHEPAYTPVAELRPVDRFTRDEVLAPLRAALRDLQDRGGARYTLDSGERWETRAQLLPGPSFADELPCITLDDLARLIGATEVDSPRRYTLPEARPLILAELCAQQGGHDLESTSVSTAAAAPVLDLVRCVRCGATFSEDPR